MLDGRRLYLRRAAVALRSRGAPWPQPTGAQLVAEARRFLGLQYLWAGHVGVRLRLLRLHLSRLPGARRHHPARRARRSSRAGVKVARTSLRAGDLVFFRGAVRPDPPRGHVRRRRAHDPRAGHRAPGRAWSRCLRAVRARVRRRPALRALSREGARGQPRGAATERSVQGRRLRAEVVPAAVSADGRMARRGWRKPRGN